jgi:hypothetical protein
MSDLFSFNNFLQISWLKLSIFQSHAGDPNLVSLVENMESFATERANQFRMGLTQVS